MSNLAYSHKPATADTRQGALVLVNNKTPLELFGPKNSLNEILDNLERDIRSIDLDISTAAGRKNVASIAYKVAKTKTTLDAMGKGLTDEARKQIGMIDADRRKMRARLDTLKDEVRKPLTEWEDKEKNRVEALEKALNDLVMLADLPSNQDIGETADRIKKASKIYGRDWEEFQHRADAEHDSTIKKLEAALKEAKKRADEKAELEKLRREKEARELKEREELIAREAAAKAQKEAEEKAARQAAEAEKRAKAERDEIERKARIAREAAAKKATEDQAKIDAAEAARKDAECKAKQAAQDERGRIEAEKKAEQEQAKEREANKKHRAKINNLAFNAISFLGRISESNAKVIVEAIAKGEIPNVKILY